MIKDVPRVGVVMCVWRRLHLLARTLDQLSDQQWVKVDLYLWNNHFAAATAVEEIAARYRHRLDIQIRHSPRNVGCFGRFYFARQIRQRYPFIGVVDDDQQFDDWVIRQLWDEKQVGGVTACHAFRFGKDRDYWERHRVQPGDDVSYCGPGGMILDSQLIEHPKFFDCPQRHWIMDDVWLSYLFHHVMRVPMKKASPTVTMTDPANDTFHSLRGRKTEFLTDLRRLGWKV